MKKRKTFVCIVAGLLAVLMVLSLILSLIPTKASAASSSEIKKQINSLKSEKAEIDAQLKKIRAEINANNNEIKDIVSQKDGIDQEIQYLNQQIENINQQIAGYSLLIADKQDELDEASAHLADLNAKHKERIRAMEEEGQLSYWSVIFKANNFMDLLDRIDMVEEINAADKKRLQEIKHAAKVVEATQQELVEDKAELVTAREELDASQLILDEKRAQADELLRQLIAKGQEFDLLMEEGEDAQHELMNEIAAKEKEYKDAQYKEWLATYVPPTTIAAGSTKPSTQVPSSTGWICPVPSYTLTSPFGMRIHPIYGYEKMHQGVDLATSQGTPIYAAKSGKVTNASFQSGGAGYYVSINHGDGFTSVYMHMTHFIVSPGQYVTTGQVIGYVGSTGASTGPHLHFGIAYNGSYINPMPYIS